MKKLLVLMLVLLASTGWAQNVALEVPQIELFSTTICTLGGIASDFVNNPNFTTDSTFAWSNKISTLIPAPRWKGDPSKVFANRAWVEIETVDSGNVAVTVDNDTMLAFVYSVGPAGGLSNAAIDTLCFILPTGTLNKPQICEISPFQYPKFTNSATLTASTNQILGDSLMFYSYHLPPTLQLKFVADCSTTTLVPSTPWADDFNDSLMFQARLILEYNQNGQPGW